MSLCFEKGLLHGRLEVAKVLRAIQKCVADEGNACALGQCQRQLCLERLGRSGPWRALLEDGVLGQLRILGLSLFTGFLVTPILGIAPWLFGFLLGIHPKHRLNQQRQHKAKTQ